MAVYGAAFFNAARLDAAVRELDQVSLRPGRYAAAQLYKLTSIGGRYIELGQLLAPFLGDVEAVTPYALVQAHRHLETFRLPTREQRPGVIAVPAWAEEVRAMPARYFQVGTLREHTGRLPARATRRGYVNVEVEVRIDTLFAAAWTRRFNAGWPMVFTTAGLQPHPALAGMIERTVVVNFAIRNNNENQRAREIRRRRAQAARHGLRVDANGRLIGAVDDSDSDVSL